MNHASVKSLLFARYSALAKPERSRRSITSFQRIRCIGRGAFGSVYLSRDRSTGSIVALKTMDKAKLVETGRVATVWAELDVLRSARGAPAQEYLVQASSIFVDDRRLYIAMECASGGDLMGLLIRRDVLAASEVAYYARELSTAIQCLHDFGFAHRDVKPDNILVFANGRVKLGDFGLARRLKADVAFETPRNDDARMYSNVGTPDYMAPEILEGTGYSSSVDWWALGIVLIECLIGHVPFYAETPLETATLILQFGQRRSTLPWIVDDSARDFCVRLVCPDDQRYQSAEQALRHRFLCWGASIPFVPNTKSDDDAQFFDVFEDDPQVTTRVEDVRIRTLFQSFGLSDEVSTR